MEDSKLILANDLKHMDRFCVLFLCYPSPFEELKVDSLCQNAKLLFLAFWHFGAR